MSLITRMLKQQAVLWAQGSQAPGDFGGPQTAAGAQIKCRWEERAENFIGPDGVTEVSQSVVYVDRDVRVGDVLMLGLLASVTDTSVPKNNAGAREVRGFGKLPDRKAKEYLRTAYL